MGKHYVLQLDLSEKGEEVLNIPFLYGRLDVEVAELESITKRIENISSWEKLKFNFPIEIEISFNELKPLVWGYTVFEVDDEVADVNFKTIIRVDSQFTKSGFDEWEWFKTEDFCINNFNLNSKDILNSFDENDKVEIEKVEEEIAKIVEIFGDRTDILYKLIDVSVSYLTKNQQNKLIDKMQKI